MLKRATMNRDTCHASSWISSILATLPSSSCFKLPESSHEQQYEKPRRRGSLRFFQSLRCDHGHDFSGLFGVALRVRRVSATRTTIMNSRQDALPCMWTRPCALCKALLTKPRLWDSIRCQLRLGVGGAAATQMEIVGLDFLPTALIGEGSLFGSSAPLWCFGAT